MLKVLLIDRYFYPDLQATSVLLTDLAEGLAEDFDIEILCGPPSEFRDLDNTKKFSKVTTLPTFQLSKKSRMGRALNYISFLILAPLAVLFHAKTDVVVVQTTPPLLPFAASIACWLRRFSYVYVANDVFPETAIVSRQLKKGVFTTFLRRLNQCALKNAKCVIAIGRDMKEIFVEQEIPAEKIEAIPNWVKTTEIKPLPKNQAFLKAKGLMDFFVVMHAGNFGYLQDFNLLLEVAQLLIAEKKVKFVFVGDGATKENVVQKSKHIKLSNVLFLSFEPRRALSEVLASADIHVVSLKHGLAGYSVPSKTYSFLASGRPIIGLLEEKSESARLIREANCGVVMENARAQEVADQIKRLMAQPNQLLEWGKSARAYIEKKDPREFAFNKYREVFLKAARK